MIARALFFSAVLIAVATNVALKINSYDRNPFAPRYVDPAFNSVYPVPATLPCQRTGTSVNTASGGRVVGQRPFSPEMYRP